MITRELLRGDLFSTVTLTLQVTCAEVQEATTYAHTKPDYQEWLSDRLFREALERRETSDGRIYYRDVATGSRTAAFPSEQEASVVPMPSSKTSVSRKAKHSLPHLPTGWEIRLTSTNHIFFVAHNTQTTSWDDPRLPLKTRLKS